MLKQEDDFVVSTRALTGEGQPISCDVSGTPFYLCGPEKHEGLLSSMVNKNPIVVDFSQPDAVNRNAELYCKFKIPFVMGTTGGDRKSLEKVVVDSGNIAVIAPNMAKPVVLMQAMLEYAAQSFPDALKGFNLNVTESHQQGKKDTSGTAKSMVEYFNKLGVGFDLGEIVKIRDPEFQTRLLRIPEEYLSGHGWHTYTLKSQDKTVELGFTHNVNGRQVYADGTLNAIRFLHSKLGEEKARGKAYSMIDVLRG